MIRIWQAWSRLVITAMVVASGFVPAAVGATTNPTDTDSNAIMWGGAYDKAAFLNKVANGDGHNSSANLKNIYYNEGRGITSSNFSSASTVDGTVFKDGHVEVNGKTVATGAVSVGRVKLTGSWADHELWARPTSVSFAANSIQAFVDLQNGVFQYAILKSCGNPVTATPVTTPTSSKPVAPSKSPSPSPSPSPTPNASDICQRLTPTQPDKRNQPTLFRFSVSNSRPYGVAVTGYRFSFSDGTDDVVTSANKNYVERTVTAGQSLTVHAVVQTNHGESDSSEACSATVTVNAASATSTPTPSPQSTGQVLGVSLPDTGPEAALGGVLGLTGMGMAAGAYVRSRRTLVSALRGKFFKS